MKILVTGGLGFIGSALIRKILDSTKDHVLNVDCCTYASMPEALEGKEKNNRYNFLKIDISNYDLINKAIQSFKPNKIFHLAAESHVDRSIVNPAVFMYTNIMGTFNILQSIKLSKNILPSDFVLLHVSTDEVFGSLTFDENPFNEMSSYQPNSPYSASKASSDLLVRAWHETYDINTVINVKDASIFHRYNTILNNVNFKINKGEFVYLIGKTGSGKSSLLKTIYGDLILKMGSINVDGHEIKDIKKSELPLIRRKLGIIFQDFQLFQDRSIAENLIFVMKATGWKKNIINDNVLKLLSKVGIEDKANRYPHQLSGGEQQRAVIARALINNPIILIADEPTGNLDPKVSENIFKLFLEINKKGTTILMATHNYELIKKFNNRTLNCIEGKVEEINVNNI